MRTFVVSIALLATGSLALVGTAHAEGEAPESASEAAKHNPATGTDTSDLSGADTLDLGSEDTFAPYSNERHPAWALLPVAAIGIVLLHLRKSKPRPKLVKGQQT